MSDAYSLCLVIVIMSVILFTWLVLLRYLPDSNNGQAHISSWESVSSVWLRENWGKWMQG